MLQCLCSKWTALILISKLSMTTPILGPDHIVCLSALSQSSLISVLCVYHRNGLHPASSWCHEGHPGKRIAACLWRGWFFSSIKTAPSTRASDLDGYLACASEEMELLHSFPLVKKLSLKLNTPLPASAACERLFSCAGQLFTPRRARLDSTNFENQLIVKLNNKFKK